MLKLNLEYNKGILFVRLDGNLIRTTSYKINNYLVPVILKHNIRYLVFNLSKLTNIDDTGIDALENVSTAVLENNGEIYLSNLPLYIRNKIRRTKIKKIESEENIYKLIGA